MEKITPMIAQYRRIKKEHPDSILLFRVGDFYETFFDDAAVASRVLGIVLTSRDHGRCQKVPLAGIPHHALERHVDKLIKAGYKVAICEQVEDPALAKGIVKREVTEVITSGTALRPSLLEERKENLLAGINCDRKECGLAFCDLSTGSLRITQIPVSELNGELARNQPVEILVPDGDDIGSLLPGGIATITPRPVYHFDLGHAEEVLTRHFQTITLEGFGCRDMPLALGAAAAVLGYLQENQRTTVSHIVKLTPYRLQQSLLLDGTTIRNLGLLPDGTSSASLLSVLDKTRTAMGARLLRRWLISPLMDPVEIESRLDAVQSLLDHPQRHRELEDLLSQIKDLERLLSRIVCQRAGPRDLMVLAASLEAASALGAKIPQGGFWDRLRSSFYDFTEVIELVRRAIEPDPPINYTQGGVIRSGYCVQLDELRAGARGDKAWVAELQQRERERTGIQSLKVGFNNVFGYYIEVSKPNLDLVPQDYIRRQTLTNAERFITPELKEREDRILGAEERARQLETSLFLEIRSSIANWSFKIKQISEAVAVIDVIQSLAMASRLYRYRRPVVDRNGRLSIKEGRHPVVEQQFSLGQFVPNDTLLDTNNRTAILTGPNMAGKSTYLRQVALISIMAQMGCFVPAQQAHLGVVDRIFTRIGASDDLTKGVSTFLAEMQETANILNNATSRSLVLLDEIGRGTSTFDGLAIAWAVAEYLHDEIGCFTLFATHYHELTELAAQRPGVLNLRMAVREWGDEVIFLRKVEAGAAGQSYGVKVARLAGLPSSVITRASEILQNLEADAFLSDATPRLARHREVMVQKPLELFRPSQQAVLREIESLRPETMTPLEALNRITKLKQMAEEADDNG